MPRVLTVPARTSRTFRKTHARLGRNSKQSDARGCCRRRERGGRGSAFECSRHRGPRIARSHEMGELKRISRPTPGVLPASQQGSVRANPRAVFVRPGHQDGCVAKGVPYEVDVLKPHIRTELPKHAAKEGRDLPRVGSRAHPFRFEAAFPQGLPLSTTAAAASPGKPSRSAHGHRPTRTPTTVSGPGHACPRVGRRSSWSVSAVARVRSY